MQKPTITPRAMLLGWLLWSCSLTTVLAAQYSGPPRGYCGYRYQVQNGWVKVTEVTPGMPAARAGMMAGDWILSFNGVNLANTTMAATQRIIHGPVGQTDTYLIQRGNQKFNLTMTRIASATPNAPGTRGLLGISYQIQQGYVRITQVTPGMPAALAGLQVGDWILACDGVSLANTNLASAQQIIKGPPGKINQLRVQRGNQQFNVSVVRAQPNAPQAGPPKPVRGIFGFNYSVVNGYVKITSVTPGYPAAHAGLAAGDWILSIDGRSLSGVTQQSAAQIMAGGPGITNALVIQRGNQKYTVNMTRVASR
ncbi:PDZ domain-containing protein [Sulfidibacter corallicola]|uniref:PDZ domain-containing protein n=1 Tax=Sulfidibacter corallicola TaxID=2818388 RepID=A0A8A4TKQ0_SULCO|nr:PDZ domain-containing protein [Sulfidibacter corallicola]QTD49418.1 PDZ domain-containing protein [Sulfidibacter corallicola]